MPSEKALEQFKNRFVVNKIGIRRKDGEGLTPRDVCLLLQANQIEPDDPLSISDAEGNHPSLVYVIAPAIDDEDNDVTWLMGS